MLHLQGSAASRDTPWIRTLSPLWAGLVVLLTSNIGHAQSQIFCNKNYTNSTIALGMQSIGACSQGDTTADKAAAIQNKLKANQQAVNSVGGAIQGVVGLFRSDSDSGEPKEQATEDEAPAGEQVPQHSRTPQGASTAAINSLLGGDESANTSTAAITSLLGNNPSVTTPAPDSTPAVVGLLVQSQPQVLGNVVPRDPQINSAFQASADPTEFGASQSQSLGEMLQSGAQGFTDGLNGLVSSGKSLISSLTADPVVKWASSDQGSLTTVPLPTAGDDPDTAANKVFGQSIVGFGDLLKGLSGNVTAFPKALYNYGTKMVNQIGADMGLASDTIFETSASSP
jgi:hypothetical protein